MEMTCAGDCEQRRFCGKMSDLRYMSREFLSEFLDLYREHECLWKIKSGCYLDKNFKFEAYKKLAEKMKEIDKNADVDLVKKKINSMRTAYRTELKKIKESKTTGAAAAKVYEPTLWYFHNLDFLRDQEIPRKGVSSRRYYSTDVNSDFSMNEECEESTSAFESSDNSCNPCDSGTVPLLRTRRRPVPKAEDILVKVGEKLDALQEDANDIFGKHVAAKVRQLNPRMRIFAEKLINDVLFEAELGTLTREAYIVPTAEQPSNFQTANNISDYLTKYNFSEM